MAVRLLPAVIVSRRPVSSVAHLERWLGLDILSNQARATLVGEIAPQPLDRDHQPVLESDQQIDMDKCPEAPGEPALQPPPAKIEDRSMPADDRRVSSVMEYERFCGDAVQDLPCKRTTEIDAFLLGNLRQSRQRIAIPVRCQRQITEHIDAPQPAYGKLSIDGDAARVIGRHAQQDANR